MTSLTLAPYQTKAVDTITQTLLRLLDVDPSEDRLLVLKAPTGSGKTVILGAAIKALSEQTTKPFAVLWLTPGEGNLQGQSAARLADMLSDTDIAVQELDRPFLSTNPHLPDRSVLVVNWQKITEQKNGKWTNNLTRDGEQRNLFQALSASTKTGTNLLVIVDESHSHIGGARSQATMKAFAEICPFTQLDTSATPTAMPDREKMSADGSHAFALVKRADVVDAGMIVKDCVLNPELEDGWNFDASATVQERVLSAAWKRRSDMEAAYRNLGSSVVPLLLIQLPDGKEATARREAVEKFLDKNNIAQSQRAVWLDKEKTSNLDGLADNTNQVRVLIFKQAIATGWDCPRAAVLVQFRDIKSKTFQLQTVGRICRMPERVHYLDELLNNAYVYTLADDGQGIEVEMPDADTPLRDLRLSVNPDLYPDTGLLLTSVFQPTKKVYEYIPAAIDVEIGKLLDEKFKNLPLTPDEHLQVSRKVLHDVVLDLETQETGRKLRGKSVSGVDDEAQMAAAFSRVLTSDILPYTRPNSNRERIRRSVQLWFARNRPEYTPEQMRAACLVHSDDLVAVISSACSSLAAATLGDAERTAAGTRKTTQVWNVHHTADSNLIEKAKATDLSQFSGCLVNPAYTPGKLSNPELRFITELSKLCKQGVVQWWWKNPENTEASLGLRRTDANGGDHAHYPDFLVMTTDGVLWVLEVKDVNDTDADNAYRVAALTQWASAENDRKRENIFGAAPPVKAGLVVPYEKDGNTTVYLSDPTNWQMPTRENLRQNIGWTELDLQK